jgi:hypothetical protein
MNPTTTNGPARKSLASQLDRLDAILDTLSEGLNEAVATAVEQAVTGAVQAAVVEVLTNPTLQLRLREGLEIDRPANPLLKAAKRVWGWLKAGVAAACTTMAGWARKAYTRTVGAATGCTEGVVSKITHACRRTRTALKAGWRRTLLALTLAGRMRKALLAALAAGLTVGLGCYYAGPVVSSLVSGVAGFAGSLAAGATRALRGMLGERLGGT